MKTSRVSFRTNSFSIFTRFRKLLITSLCLAVISPVFANTTNLFGEPSVTNLRWRSPIIRIAISPSILRDSPNIKHDSDVAGAIKRSIESWTRIANIDLRQVTTDKLSASPSGASGDGVSLITIAQTPENVLLFSKDPESAAATTRVFYNRRGSITEADIVLNPFQQFSTDGTMGTFDLESTLTHELGHLLGLSHSEVFGSTMYANDGKNGVFGSQRLISRTLSADDVAAVRALYGARGDEGECCGVIEGKLTIPGRPNRTIEVWIEDSSGRVHGYAKASQAGDFTFGGLNQGRYRLFAHEPGRSRNAMPAQEIGSAIVTRGETTALSARASLGASTADFDISYVGSGGQVADMAVSISSGRSYLLYVGGRNLDAKDLSFRFTSPEIVAVPSSLRSMDYGNGITVVSFEVRVSSRALKGEYTIFAETRTGDRRAIIGALAIENPAGGTPTFPGFDD